MPTATLRAFRDQQSGEAVIETAPLGMLLVIGVGDAYDVGVGGRSIGSAVGGFAVGPQSCHGSSALTGTAEGVQVDLTWSAAAAIFGPELSDLADQAVVITDLSGGRTLVDQMVDESAEERVMLIRQWLRSRAETHRGPPPGVARALRRIEEGAGSVGDLAAELGCSRGHLHRSVRAVTGQSPTTLMRIVRLHRLIRHRGNGRLADLAAAGGYADHAHLCHETRLLAGRTPSELFGRVDDSW
jgi:AraC-like DNA-binding protein